MFIIGLTMIMAGAYLISKSVSNSWVALGAILIYLGTIAQFGKEIFKR